MKPNEYYISVRRDGAKKGTIDRSTPYSSRKEAVDAAMDHVAQDNTITGITIYRQRFDDWPGMNNRPLWCDPVLSAVVTSSQVTWRDVSGHPTAKYLERYTRR